VAGALPRDQGLEPGVHDGRLRAQPLICWASASRASARLRVVRICILEMLT
jgi:hypothetical protein